LGESQQATYSDIITTMSKCVVEVHSDCYKVVQTCMWSC